MESLHLKFQRNTPVSLDYIKADNGCNWFLHRKKKVSPYD